LKAGAERVRDIDPHSHVEVTVTLKGPALPDPKDMPKQAMTPEQFAKQYAVDPKTVQKVEDVLRGYGLSVDGVAFDGRSIRVSGPAASIQEAFPSQLGIYRSADQGEFRGRVGTIGIPAELDGIIESVLGLDQRQVAHRKTAVAAATASSPLSPADLEKRYNFPPGTASGQTIAIAEFGTPVTSTAVAAPGYFPDDVSAFCAKSGRAAAKVTVVPLNVAPLTLQQLQQLPPNLQSVSFDETGEVMMDIEIVSALCSEATILVYFASFDQKGWVDLLDAVVDGKHPLPASLSVSWGLAEDSPDWSAGAVQAINERLQTTSMLGVTVCVSAGDDGSGDAVGDSRGHVDFPAASPFVLSVGGTMLVGAGESEVAWWQTPGRRTPKGGGATGGGVSAAFKRPPWQNVHVASINPGSIDGRVVPDVSALAGPPLYDLILVGRDAPNGGTSASAPLWASLIARIYAASGKPRRFLTPVLYQNGTTGKPIGAESCRDIVTGSNASNPKPGKGYTAGLGFDAVSGWGVPDGVALEDAL
jgi:kumamolisin